LAHRPPGYHPEVRTTTTDGLAGPAVPAGTGRDETPEERSDRNLQDLLQELRVAAIGIQVLFGFLLSLPFSARFRLLDTPQRALYLAALLSSAVATVLLAAPVAYHRRVFQLHVKDRLVRAANRTVVAGLWAVGLAVTSAVALVVSFVLPGAAAGVVAAATAAWFVVLWGVVPHRAARRASGTAGGAAAADGPAR
jgi:hypothetical protein